MKHATGRVRLALACSFALALADGAQAAARQMKITFGGYSNSPAFATLANFPVLVTLSNNVGSSGFTYGDFLSGSGHDLRFVADPADTTSLNYEIESWNTNAGQASHVWVQVPSLPGDGTGAIWAKWGDPDDQGQLSCTTDGTTWDGNYQGVWHLGESSGPQFDATANDYDGTPQGGATLGVSGKVGLGGSFSGSDVGVQVGSGLAGVVGAANMTMECWAYLADTSKNGSFLQFTAGSAGKAGYGVGVGSGDFDHAGNTLIALYEVVAWVPCTTSIGTGWHHVAFRLGTGGVLKLFLDGNSVFDFTQPAIQPSDNSFYIGGYGGTRNPNCELDEVRVSNTPRSDDWLKATYMTVASPTFSTYGAVEAQPAQTVTATPTFSPPAGTYLGARSVTIATTTTGATIRYTTDGSTPSSTLGTVYSAPVSIAGNLTLKAIAYKDGEIDSTVASGAYTILPAYFWDSNGDTAGAGVMPTGTWGPSGSAFWNTDADGGAGIFFDWRYDMPNVVFSAGTDSTGAVIGIIYEPWVQSITVEEGAYTFNGVFRIGHDNLPAGLTVNAGGVGTTFGSSTIMSRGNPLTFTIDGDTTLNGPLTYESNWYLPADKRGSATLIIGNTFSPGYATRIYAGTVRTTGTGTIIGGGYGAHDVELRGGNLELGNDLGVNSGGFVDWYDSGSKIKTDDATARVLPANMGLFANPTFDSPGDLRVTGNVVTYLGSGTTTVTVNNNGKIVLAGSFTGGSFFNLLKAGSGILAIDGYAGLRWWESRVNEGTLLVNGSWAGNDSATLVVANGATLGGTGAIASAAASAVTVEAGGTLAPGAGVGTLTVNGAVTFAGDSALNIELGGTTLTVNGSLTIGANCTLILAGNSAGTIVRYTGVKPTEFAQVTAGYTVSYATPGEITVGLAGTVTTPTFSPPAGTYLGAQSVTIATATEGATIRYTTDGSTPSPTEGTVYSNTVSISANTTLKAIAYKDGLNDSGVASGDYTIATEACATPTFSPPAGSYLGAQSVTIGTTTADATIRYTTDGSVPSQTQGTVYGAPVRIADSLTLKAIAYKAGTVDSTVASGAYTITPAYFWDSNGDAAGAGVTPTGTWGVDAFWNAVADGTGTPGTWGGGSSGNDAVFSAGTDSTGAVITIGGVPWPNTITVEEGAYTFNGELRIGNGGQPAGVTVNAGGAGTTFGSSTIFTRAGPLTFMIDGDTTLNGLLTYEANWYLNADKRGSATLTIGNTFMPGFATRIHAGTVRTTGAGTIIGGGYGSHDVELRGGNLELGNDIGVNAGGFIDWYDSGSNLKTVDATARVLPANLALSADPTFGGPGDLTIGGTVNGGNSSRIVTVNGGTTTFGVPVSGFTALTKAGAGTLFLNGTNTYTGVTTVTAGGIGGNGKLAGNLVLNADTRFEAVMGTTLTVGNLTIGANCTLNVAGRGVGTIIRYTGPQPTLFAHLTGEGGYALNYATPGEINVVLMGIGIIVR